MTLTTWQFCNRARPTAGRNRFHTDRHTVAPPLHHHDDNKNDAKVVDVNGMPMAPKPNDDFF